MQGGDFLDFERPIAELDAKINELRHTSASSDINIAEEISRLKEKGEKLATSIFSNLRPDQVLQVARHPLRPYSLDYIEQIFDSFDELHGDRHYGDDAALIGGIATLDGKPVMVIGHQKGREVDEKVKRNFGMPKPEGYRKALRLMKMAEKFAMPIITFIDTPGAYPGVGAEERNQSEAIARNLLELATLKTPVVCVVIGEGGSGGALAIGVGDVTLMLEYSVYSVISPEGCASILWKTAEKSKDAAAAMGITAQALHANQLIDEIIPEPIGGAHRSPQEMAGTLKAKLSEQLNRLQALSHSELINARQKKLMLPQINSK